MRDLASHSRLLPVRGPKRAADHEAVCAAGNSLSLLASAQQGIRCRCIRHYFLQLARSCFDFLRTEKPSVLGIYANLMTRSNVIEILAVAREAGWKTVVGGPEPGAYSLEYLQAGADFVVSGEGELTMEELLLALRSGDA